MRRENAYAFLMGVLERRQKLECMLFLTLLVVNKSENPKKITKWS